MKVILVTNIKVIIDKGIGEWRKPAVIWTSLKTSIFFYLPSKNSCIIIIIIIIINDNNDKHAGDNYTNCNWCVWNSNKRITKGTGRLGSWRTSGDHSNDSIIENDQNTENSPGDLRGLAVTQTPVKNHRLTLMWKALMSE